MNFYILLLAATLGISVLTGCQPPQPEPALTPTGCATPACIAELRLVSQPQSAATSEPDPTRDAMTAEMRRQLTDRMTDFIYTAAAGDLATDHPETMPANLADRNQHDRCLLQNRDIIYQYTDPAQPDANPPDDFYREQAQSLQDCLAEGNADWSRATTAERSLWIRRILQAYARANDPAEYHRHLLHNEQNDPGWAALRQEFQPCHDLAIPLSDRIAVVAEPAEVSAQVLHGIAEIAGCSFNLTQIRYPEPSATPAPGSPAGTGGSSSPSP